MNPNKKKDIKREKPSLRASESTEFDFIPPELRNKMPYRKWADK